MTQEQFKEFIKGKIIESVELDSINQERGFELSLTEISITKIVFTDKSEINMGYDSYVKTVIGQRILHSG